MPDKAWKAFERRVARFFHGERAPVHNKETRADVLHDDLYLECKQRANPSIWKLWEETADRAKKEGKTPVICYSKKYKNGFLIVVHSDDFLKV